MCWGRLYMAHDQVIATCNAFPGCSLACLFRRGESSSVASSGEAKEQVLLKSGAFKGSDFQKKPWFLRCFSYGQAAKPSQAP